MNALDHVLAAAAAFAAGGVNALAGGGTLISFPVLVALGVPPVSANVTNTVALSPGYLGGAIAQKAAILEQKERVKRLGLASVVGGLGGAFLLVLTSNSTFKVLIPILLFGATLLLATQDRIRRVLKIGVAPTQSSQTGITPTQAAGATPTRAAQAAPAEASPTTPIQAAHTTPTRAAQTTPAQTNPAQADAAANAGITLTPADGTVPTRHGDDPAWLALPVLAMSVYGGYFGAGLGIMLLATLGVVIHEPLARLNALKQVLSLIINTTAALFFITSGKVYWSLAAVMAVASLVGGNFGGRLAGKVQPAKLRIIVVSIGFAAAIVYAIRSWF